MKNKMQKWVKNEIKNSIKNKMLKKVWNQIKNKSGIEYAIKT